MMAKDPIFDLTGQNRSLEQLHDQTIERLKSGGGGGTSDGMEPRIQSLERTALQLAIDMAYVKGRIEDMPTKDWMTTRLIWVVSSMSAVMALIGFLLKAL